ncbi:MAG: ATP-grasp domain-containing protein, partial [Christensenellaceae bacterium]|nr:ATP-grasp domain-containing protein [Christensenellaceae bacterium]
NAQELTDYMTMAAKISPEHPVLIDKYIVGKEAEIDGICDGQDAMIVGIMEHIERAGVHSGDSFAVYPPQTLSDEVKHTIVDYAMRIGVELGLRGLYNIQFVIDRDSRVYVLEVNPRASRTVPILSKVTGVPMVAAATRIMLGETLSGMGMAPGLHPESRLITVKAPVFSFSKLTKVDVFLGPEMKSTGEVMGTDTTFLAALKKAFVASGMRPPRSDKPILFSITDRDKEEAQGFARQMLGMGFDIAATDGTHAAFAANGIRCRLVPHEDVVRALKEREISMVINTPTRGKLLDRLGFIIRRTAIEFNIPCITSMDTLAALLSVMTAQDIKEHCIPLQEYLNYDKEP